MKENVSKKYNLVELATGKYFDKKLNQNLILKQNYVELNGDEFKKNAVAMILYSYENGKNRTETAEAFVQYGEDNLEVIELDESKQQDFIKGAVVEGSKIQDDVPAIIDVEQREFRP